MAKKTPESKEDAAARRQRELAALTSGVAAFSLMGETPAPAPVEAPAAETPAPVAAPVREPEAAKPAATTPAAKPAATPAKRGGEGPAPAAPASMAAVSEPEEQDQDEDEDEAEDVAEEDAGAVAVEAAAPAASGELDLAQLFVPSSGKKGTTLRITADHQQFFTNLGFLLGNGASAPDIIHNILTRFRAEHEAQIQKAMRKQMKLLLSPKK